MFVDHIESPSKACAESFLIGSSDDLARIRGSAAISMIIDTARGDDIRATADGWQAVVASFEDDLRQKFDAGQLEAARSKIEHTAPIVRSVFSQVRLSGAVRLDEAEVAIEQILSTNEESMPALISLARLKSKDEGTFMHSLAVSALMISFARQIGMSSCSVRTLALAGLLHDVGKMALPEAILNKAGKLSPEEYAVVRTHPALGAELLGAFESVPEEVVDVCLHHHERYDGTGYPHRLRGKAISQVARLAAICDVYEAMTSIRPYKRAWTQIEAVKAMQASPGHFDRRLLEKFVAKVVISGAAG